MRKTAISPVFALLLLMGCSTATAGAEATPATPAETIESPDPQTARATEKQSCLELLGPDGQGPLSKISSAVIIRDGTSGVALSAEDARPLHDAVLAVAEAAPEDISQLVKQFSSPTENVLRKAENPDASWNLNVDTWTAAASELQNRCEAYTPPT